jgi:hypothetical protein
MREDIGRLREWARTRTRPASPPGEEDKAWHASAGS